MHVGTYVSVCARVCVCMCVCVCVCVHLANACKPQPLSDCTPRIPAYGFGDKTTGDHSVFSFLPNDQPMQGMESVLARYRCVCRGVACLTCLPAAACPPSCGVPAAAGGCL